MAGLILGLVLSWVLMAYAFFRFMLPGSVIVENVASALPAFLRFLVKLIFAVPFLLALGAFCFFVFLVWGGQ